MTTQEIQQRIENIRAVARDCESAHIQESNLRDDFIRYVSTMNNPDLAAKAKLVLTTEEIDFSRWYA